MLGNRYIKFRAWHGGHEYAEPEMLYDEKPGDCLVYRNQKQNIVAVMQYTGLKDKNGKEIYEGDILQSVHSQTGKVFFSEGHFMVRWNHWQLGDYDSWLNEVAIGGEVIGNIYEHPNLLKEANNDAQTK